LVECGVRTEVGLLDDILGVVVILTGVAGDAVEEVEMRESLVEEGPGLFVHCAHLPLAEMPPNEETPPGF
jgi:hypothetical protein